MLSMVCNDVKIEPVLQELTVESLPRGANKAPDARLDIHARGFWERQRTGNIYTISLYNNRQYGRRV